MKNSLTSTIDRILGTTRRKSFISKSLIHFLQRMNILRQSSIKAGIKNQKPIKKEWIPGEKNERHWKIYHPGDASGRRYDFSEN